MESRAERATNRAARHTGWAALFAPRSSLRTSNTTLAILRTPSPLAGSLSQVVAAETVAVGGGGHRHRPRGGRRIGPHHLPLFERPGDMERYDTHGRCPHRTTVQQRPPAWYERRHRSRTRTEELVGVVRARHGGGRSLWLRDTVWVARSEDVAAFVRPYLAVDLHHAGDRMLRDAEARLRQGQYDRAVDDCDEHLRTSPTAARAFFLKAVARLKGRQPCQLPLKQVREIEALLGCAIRSEERCIHHAMLAYLASDFYERHHLNPPVPSE